MLLMLTLIKVHDFLAQKCTRGLFECLGGRG